VFESQFWWRYCQTFSTGFNSGAREGRKNRHYVVGHFELGRRVPSGPVEQRNGTVSVARDFVEVELRHVGVRLGDPNAAPTPRAGRIALKT
jgi:hypothetical protein